MSIRFRVLKEIFSSAGEISSKRVIGSTIIMISMFCIVYLVFNEGGTDNVGELISTSLILGAALLGVSNITSIWKSGGKKSDKLDKPD